MRDGLFVLSGATKGPQTELYTDGGLGRRCWALAGEPDCGSPWCGRLAKIRTEKIQECVVGSCGDSTDGACPPGCTADEDQDCSTACGLDDGVCPETCTEVSSDTDCGPCSPSDGVCTKNHLCTNDPDCGCAGQGEACSVFADCCDIPGTRKLCADRGSGLTCSYIPACGRKNELCTQDEDCCSGLVCGESGQCGLGIIP